MLSDRGVVVKEGGSHSTGYVRSKKEVVNVEGGYFYDNVLLILLNFIHVIFFLGKCNLC